MRRYNTVFAIRICLAIYRSSRWLSYVETSVAGLMEIKKAAAGGFDGAQPPGEAYAYASLQYSLCYSNLFGHLP
jgi:hypothetical protein